MTRETADRLSDIHSYGLDVSKRTIYLQNKEEVENSGVDYRMSQVFLKNIKILELINDDAPITIYMQSEGGCWYAGMGIYDAIKQSRCKTTIVAYNQAESMSSIILQAANRRILMPNCIFMCHYGSSDTTGDFLSAQNFASVDKHNMYTMIDVYAERCIKTGKYFKDRGDSFSKVKTYIKRKMKDGDWYLTAEQAVYYGFADAVFSKSTKI
jgi:ATP-dependent Clp protease protease subunit